jgi:hypothetical protein
MSALNKIPITSVAPGDVVFVNIRSYGEQWYVSTDLPDLYHINYVVEWNYVSWVKRNFTLRVSCSRFTGTFTITHSTVRSWGDCKIFDPDTMVLITDELMEKYPKLKE